MNIVQHLIAINHQQERIVQTLEHLFDANPNLAVNELARLRSDIESRKPLLDSDMERAVVETSK